MVATETLLDEGMIYFDARLSRSYPTLEVRVADVCLRAEDTVLIAALTRALVETAAGEHRDGVPTPAIRSEVLRLATWQAGRSGLGGRLVHPRDGSPAPAPAVIAALVEYVRPALEQAGEYSEATERLDTVLSRGTGADQQRSIYRRRSQLSDIVTAARI
jgi:carboxylate-amine ligase